MHGIFTNISVIYGVNAGKYSIDGASAFGLKESFSHVPTGGGNSQIHPALPWPAIFYIWARFGIDRDGFLKYGTPLVTQLG